MNIDMGGLGETDWLTDLTIAACTESFLNSIDRFPEFMLKFCSVKFQQFLRFPLLGNYQPLPNSPIPLKDSNSRSAMVSCISISKLLPQKIELPSQLICQMISHFDFDFNIKSCLVLRLGALIQNPKSKIFSDYVK
jgi:hypothetical protein